MNNGGSSSTGPQIEHLAGSETQTPSITDFSVAPSLTAGAEGLLGEAGPSAGIPANDLYPHIGQTAAELQRVLLLLEEASRFLDRAVGALAQNEILESDDALHGVQAVLAEAFVVHSIGEGLETLVVALHSSCAHRGGTLFSDTQVRAMQTALRRLQVEPFMRLADAIDIVGELDAQDLEVIPPALDEVADITGD